MSNKEATTLARLIRKGSEEAAIIVIKQLGVKFQAKNGIKTKRPKYNWITK